MLRGRIFIVEDEKVTIRSLTTMIEKLDYIVIGTSSSGEDALIKIEELLPDVILMDISLEGTLDGVETTRLIHEKLNIPVIYLTADSEKDTIHRAKVTEPYGYLIKPTKIRELHTILEIALYKHKVEEQLRQSEEKYRSLIEGMPDVVYRLDKDGNFTFISDNILEFGYSPKELIGKHFSTILHPEDTPHVSKDAILTNLKGKETGDINSPKLFDERRTGYRKTSNLSVRIKPRDINKNYHFAKINSTGVYDRDVLFRDKKFVGTLGIIKNLKYMHDSESKERENTFIASLENGDEIIFKINKWGNFTFCSKNISKYDIEPEDIIGTHISTAFNNTGETPSKINLLFGESTKNLHDDWKDVWAEVSVSGEQNKPYDDSGSIGTIRNISTSKKNEALLSRTVDNWETIVNSITDPFSIHDLNHNIIYANSSFHKKHNSEENDFKEKPCYRIISGIDEPHENCPLLKNKTSIDPMSIEVFDIKNKSYSQILVSPITKDNKITGLVHEIKDVTERVEYHEKLKQSHEEAIHASKAKSEFLAKMSHEIRTPLNAIIGMTDLANSSNDLVEIKDLLNIIQDSGNHLSTVINDILDLSKIEAGEFNLKNEDFEIRGLMNSIVRLFSVQTQDKSISMNLNIDEDVPLYINCDSNRLRQILINIIGNAVKFTDFGKIIINISATHIEEEEKTLKLYFKIADSGIGIEEERLTDIFESFKQIDNSFSRSHGGTGLGLPISKQIIEKMQGEITVESTMGSGTIFSFYINVKEGSPVYNIKNTETIDIDPLNILLAEDNEFNIKLATALLEKKGHSVTCAFNGIEALEYIKDTNFDIILMDIEMPLMDGFEATVKIRDGEAGNEKSNIPIIAITAHAVKEVMLKCIESGMNDYISKPIKINDLNKKIIEILNLEKVI